MHVEINARYNRTNYAEINGSVVGAAICIRPNKIPSLITSFCTSSVCLQSTRLPAGTQFSPLIPTHSLSSRRWHFFSASVSTFSFALLLTPPLDSFFVGTILYPLHNFHTFFFLLFAYHQNIMRTTRAVGVRQTERNLNFQWSLLSVEYCKRTTRSTRFTVRTIAESEWRCRAK